MAIGALHRRLTYRAELWPFHVLAFDTGEVFLARRQPSLYDRSAKRVPAAEIAPGSVVRVRFEVTDGVRWMTAVQIIALAEDQPPFDPVGDGETG